MMAVLERDNDKSIIYISDYATWTERVKKNNKKRTPFQ